MATLVGTILGKYRIVARLGRGGMAEVYKAYQPGMNRYVAIKVLHSQFVDDPNFIGRFEREALAVGKLRHANIVQAFDFDREDDIYFMAMEYINGPTLSDELAARRQAGKPYSLKEIARIFTALCSAIDYAHTRGMVHRDLKPANVMINEEGQVVLTDFGITRMLGAAQFTQTGAMPGTPAYMSPEQARGQHGDTRSDIYSLGVMLYELTTGVVPFDADTPLAIILKHVSAPLPLPTKIAPDLPPAVEGVIVKAMHKQPAERYQRADDLAAALREAVGLGADELYRPLPVIAAHPQIQELDPAAKLFTDQVKPISRPTPPVGATLPPPPPAPTLPPAAPPRLYAIMPLLLGGGLLVVLLLGGLVGWLLLSNRNNPAATPPVTPTGTALARIELTTPTVDPNVTSTAQAQVTAIVAPTLTAQAVEAEATATVIQQTAEAQIIAGFLSAQTETATAQAAQTAAAGATATTVAQATATQVEAEQAATAEIQAAQTVQAQVTATQVEAEQAAAATATAQAEAEQAATAEIQVAQTVQAQATQNARIAAQARTGLFNDFETASNWRRGDEANGTFERSAAEAHAGDYAGELRYNFSTPNNDYVVFSSAQPLGGQPNQITAWIYGDGAGHFLNVWVKDSAGEMRQYSFGQIKHSGWQQMSALLTPGQPWPAGSISGPDNGVLDYPISFQALVLDDGSDDFSGDGVIYIDDLASAEGTTPPPAPTGPAASPITFRADRTSLRPGECALLSWSVENVSAVYLNGEGVPGQFSRQVCLQTTTTYTLRVIRKDGAVVDTPVTITVQ